VAVVVYLLGGLPDLTKMQTACVRLNEATTCYLSALSRLFHYPTEGARGCAKSIPKLPFSNLSGSVHCFSLGDQGWGFRPSCDAVWRFFAAGSRTCHLLEDTNPVSGIPNTNVGSIKRLWNQSNAYKKRLAHRKGL